MEEVGGLPVSSTAFTGHFVPLLAEAFHIRRAAEELPAKAAGRLLRVAALNRAVVVTCVSAWEAYIEELVREALNAIRPPLPPLGVWPALNATVRGQLGRFNTPNAENIRMLLSDAFGLHDIQDSWTWQNCSSAQAVKRLADTMASRHQIAHGVNPRPLIPSLSSRRLPEFFQRLARCTDRAVRDHLVTVHGIANPWPA
jgi:hypothetical protein